MHVSSCRRRCCSFFIRIRIVRKELTKFMAINRGHNVPLSVIIDKHWDKLKYHMREDPTTNDY
jgi:hypothetical protein